jgi:hypothetical protein
LGRIGTTGVITLGLTGSRGVTGIMGRLGTMGGRLILVTFIAMLAWNVKAATGWKHWIWH